MKDEIIKAIVDLEETDMNNRYFALWFYDNYNRVVMTSIFDTETKLFLDYYYDIPNVFGIPDDKEIFDSFITSRYNKYGIEIKVNLINPYSVKDKFEKENVYTKYVIDLLGEEYLINLIDKAIIDSMI